MAHFKDDVYVNVTNDIEKIQVKPTMYISYIGDRAYLHLAKELINNIIDEATNPKTISDGSGTILYDETENMLYVEDSGRGIPFEELENACTILHSGTKMRRSNGKSAGENGVGLTATNALSQDFEITSYRDGMMKMITFKEGKKVSEREAKSKSNKHGLLVAIRPSKLFLGPATLPVDELDDWLTKLSFFMPKKMKMKLNVNRSGKEATMSKTYQNIKGIGGFLERFEPEFNLLKTPIVLIDNTTILETGIPYKHDNGEITLVDKTRIVDLQVAINFNENSDDTSKYSFCNDIETVEHGEHMTAVTNAVVQFIRKKVKDSSKSTEEVTANDILYGLGLVVNMGTDYSTGLFTGQTKHKMDNKIFYEPIRKMVLDQLDNYFKMPENKRTLNKVISFVKENIRARVAATKTRQKSKSKKSTFLETTLIAGLVAPNMIDKEGYKCELYFVEGDSAGGGANTARYDNDIQGVLCLTGKPNNIYGTKYSDITPKSAPDMIRLFDDILGCGYGSHFNIDNLRYDKLIGGTDADVDGSHIFGIVVADIYKHARPLIEQGHVYRAVTPLYRLYDKSETKNGKSKTINRSLYLYSKDQFFDVYETNASDVIKLKFDIDGNFVSRANVKRFLQTNRDYFQQLDQISNFYTLHGDIVEFIAMYPDFRERLSDKFPEMHYEKEHDSLVGVYQGDIYNIILDKVFLDRVAYLTKVINDGNDGVGMYHMYRKYKTKGEPEYVGYLTIGQIMSVFQTLEPVLSQRFKGLGEMDPIELLELVMNPNNRKLIRMTVNDAERTTAIFDELFLESKRGARKILVRDTEISVDDIDN